MPQRQSQGVSINSRSSLLSCLRCSWYSVESSTSDSSTVDEYLRYNSPMKKNYMPRDFQLIAGVDEVGRALLAGPVVAATVILP